MGVTISSKAYQQLQEKYEKLQEEFEKYKQRDTPLKLGTVLLWKPFDVKYMVIIHRHELFLVNVNGKADNGQFFISKGLPESTTLTELERVTGEEFTLS